MSVLFTPVTDDYTDREIRVDYSVFPLPIFNRGSCSIFIIRAYITYRKRHDDPGPQATWFVKRIKLVAGTSIGAPIAGEFGTVVITDLDEELTDLTVPWWLMKAVVQGLGFVR